MEIDWGKTTEYTCFLRARENGCWHVCGFIILTSFFSHLLCQEEMRGKKRERGIKSIRILHVPSRQLKFAHALCQKPRNRKKMSLQIVCASRIIARKLFDLEYQTKQGKQSATYGHFLASVCRDPTLPVLVRFWQEPFLVFCPLWHRLSTSAWTWCLTSRVTAVTVTVSSEAVAKGWHPEFFWQGTLLQPIGGKCQNSVATVEVWISQQLRCGLDGIRR